MMRNSLLSAVGKLNSDNGLFVFLLLDKALFGITKGVVYVCAYVVAKGCPYCDVFEVESGTELLEGCLSDILG